MVDFIIMPNVTIKLFVGNQEGQKDFCAYSYSSVIIKIKVRLPHPTIQTCRIKMWMIEINVKSLVCGEGGRGINIKPNGSNKFTLIFKMYNLCTSQVFIK